MLSCYLVSSMVIVTQESTSSVGFPSQRPVGIDKFVNCIARVKPFLLRAGGLAESLLREALLSPGAFLLAPKAQFFPRFWFGYRLLM